jgi:hypothetical protein
VTAPVVLALTWVLLAVGRLVSGDLFDAVFAALLAIGWFAVPAGIRLTGSQLDSARRVGWGYGYGAGVVDGEAGRYDPRPPCDGRTRGNAVLAAPATARRVPPGTATIVSGRTPVGWFRR